QHGAGLAVDRDKVSEALSQLNVGLVRGYHKAGVGEVCDLILHGFDDFWMGCTHGGDGDARTQVDNAITVNVFHDAAFCARDKRWRRGAYGLRNVRFKAFAQLTSFWPGEFGNDFARLVEGFARHEDS